jgi:uncharacterized protein
MNDKLHTYVERQASSGLRRSLQEVPVTAVLGPRQCGKSTLARKVISGWGGATVYLDMERPSDRRRMQDPELYLSQQRGKLVCIDEVQRMPELFSVLRVLVDDEDLNLKFLVLGSASPDLLKQSSETLAGRIRYVELTPFQWREVASMGGGEQPRCFKHWRRGGFPGSYLAGTEAASLAWREHFSRTFLERDIPMQAGIAYSETIERLWRMAAHVHGQLLNSSRLGGALGISHVAVRNYLGLLQGAYMLRLLPPMHANLKKRLVKAPKLYFRDSGILHGLLELEGMDALLGHPAAGASWEGWCIEQLVVALPRWRASFYRDSNGQEMDLVLERGQRRLAFEFKLSLSPELGRGTRSAMELLQVERTFLVCPMEGEGYDSGERVRTCGIAEALSLLDGCD